MDKIYDVSHFIKKFEAISEQDWITGSFGSISEKKCALGHCGMNSSHHPTDEAKALAELLAPVNKNEMTGIYPKGEPDWWYHIVYPINDGHLEQYKQKSAKKRILAALYDIKKLIEPTPTPESKPKEIIKYISVPDSLTQQARALILTTDITN